MPFLDITAERDAGCARIDRLQNGERSREQRLNALGRELVQQLRFIWIVSKEGRVARASARADVADRDLIEGLLFEQREQRVTEREPRALDPCVRSDVDTRSRRR